MGQRTFFVERSLGGTALGTIITRWSTGPERALTYTKEKKNGRELIVCFFFPIDKCLPERKRVFFHPCPSI